MSNKIKLLTGAVAAALSMGFASQASATVYGSSALEITDLKVAFLNAQGNPALSAVTVDSFSYTLTNTATLNNVPSISLASCAGSPSSNTCGTTSPVLDAAAVNAIGSNTTSRTNNETGADGMFTWYAPNGGDWSNSDSVIYDSQLTSGGLNPTHTDQIAQSNITNASQASANAQIQSVTGVTLNFTVGDDPVNFSLSFSADVDMVAQIINELFGVYGAQADTALSVSLNQNNGSALVFWAPQGTFGGATDNNCAAAGVTCIETADAEDLNLTIGTTVNNTIANHSAGGNIEGSDSYGIFVSGLEAGKYTLTLSALTSTSTYRVPEPATLALLGVGLLGLGFAGRRQRKQA